MGRFQRTQDFSALSLRDLAEARELFHVQLANLEHVVATALGRYRIRSSDPDHDDPRERSDWGSDDPRTLANSSVQPWSWPSLLVFVDRWLSTEEMRVHPDEVVPPRVYLPDGRAVPTCVVHVQYAEGKTAPEESLRYPSTFIGGGYPFLSEAQGRQRIGSLGCLVTEGSRTYALTSQHALGAVGDPVYVFSRGRRRPIGTVASSQPVHVRADEIYPELFDERSRLRLDAGLIELNDVAGWTTQVFAIGALGAVVDVSVDTVSLQLLGTPVRAFGAASGDMEGEIAALFYRYRSRAGSDSVAELLIGPRTEESAVASRPGDSGTIWVWDEQADREAPGNEATENGATAGGAPENGARPLGLQWGGQVLATAAGQPVDFALASSLASVCRHLDVEVLHDDSMADHSLYWGKTGHYAIATFACGLAPPRSDLDALLDANLDRISVPTDDIENKRLPTAHASGKFVPLADVPDLVWRATRKRDAANHFADMDEPGGDAVEGRTLLELWSRGGKWRTPDGWLEFYDSLDPSPSTAHRGSLPFRVAQLYEEMVGALQAGDVVHYVGVAGVLAHYVGDACQPLHVSSLHHGEPDDKSDDDVHAVYETAMLDRFRADVVAGVTAELDGYTVGADGGPELFEGGDEAADTVVALMRRTVKALPPVDIVETFTDDGDARAPTERLWDAYGDRTILRLADGARVLAAIWKSAWDEGNGNANVDDLGPVDKNALRGLYENDDDFARAQWLKDYGKELVPA